MKRTSLAALLLLGFTLAAACSGNTIDGQGQGCSQDSDCPGGNNLKCVPLRNATGGSCQIQCDPAKPSCPTNQVCGELPNILPAVCKPSSTSGAGGSTGTGTTGATTSSTSGG